MAKSLRFFLIFISFLASVTILFHANSASATYNPAYLISDSIFNDINTMSIADIQNFLANKGSGLANYSATENCDAIKTPYSGTYFTHCGQNVSAATIIYDAGRAYTVNPRVILATLQKEQSLITTPNPTSSQLNCAMGFASCSGFVGFFSQVDNGTWQLRTDIELMSGRSWWGYSPTSYPCKNASSLYSTGLYPGNTVTFYNPGGVARTVTLGNASTAALYCYTPHVGPYSETGYSGSYNFVVAFETWFGSTASACYNDTNVASTTSGGQFMRFDYNSAVRLAYTQQNNTGTACTELHLESTPFTNWAAHVTTPMRATDPTLGMLVPSKSAIDSQYSMNYITYGGVGGHVEVHRMSPNMRTFPGYYDVATNLTSITPSTGTFVAGDFFGRGYDQLLLIIYGGTGGRVELHMFDPTMRSAIGYYDIATDLTNVTASTGKFVAGDFFGRGYDQLAFVLNGGTGGRAEVHMFNPQLTKAIGYYDVATDLTNVTNTTGTFVGGDFLGRRYAQLVYIIYSGTNSRVETHMFNPQLTRAIGFQDIITNMGTFDPNQ